MIETISTLKRRLKTINSTRHITHAMEIVSATKLRKAEIQFVPGILFFDKMKNVFATLTLEKNIGDFPYFRKTNGGNSLYLILTSDKGLCGGFNSVLVEYAHKKILEMRDKEPLLFFIGKKGREYFKKFPETYNIYDSFVDLYGYSSKEITEKILKHIKFAYFNNQKQIGSVYIFSYKMITRGRHKPVIQRLLPISNEDFTDETKNEDKNEDYITEPSLELVVEKLAPKYIKAKIYLTLLEQRLCEHSARMILMNNATKNCDELKEELTLKMNKARQTIITRELIDVVGGSEALK